MAFDSPDYFNRYAYREEREGRKRRIYFDDFSRTNLSNWNFVNVVRAFDRVFSGEASLKFSPGAAAGDAAVANIYLGGQVSKVILTEFYHLYDTWNAHCKLDCYLVRVADGYFTYQALEWNSQTEKWYYKDSAENVYELPNAAQKLTKGTSPRFVFHRFTFVIDFENEIPLYFISDDMLIDLTEIPIIKSIEAEGRNDLYVSIYQERTATSGTLNWWVDKFLVAEA